MRLPRLTDFELAMAVMRGPQGQRVTETEAVDIAEDYVPTIDDADLDAPPPTTYRDWKSEDTRIVVFTTAPHRYSKDRPAANRASARAQCELAFGKILEANYLPERFFFRVKR